MHEIERALRRGASTPHTKYNKEKIENHILEVQQLLDTLNAQSSAPDENLRTVEHNLALDEPHDAPTTSASEEGMSSPPHARNSVEC